MRSAAHGTEHMRSAAHGIPGAVLLMLVRPCAARLFGCPARLRVHHSLAGQHAYCGMPDAPASCWLHPSVEVRPSDVAGRGLFTTVDLSARTTVWRLGAPLVDPAELHGFGNHGCDPNLGWVDAYSLATMVDVPAGRELLTDYAMATADPAYLLRCHCESYRCRQMVEGTDWQIPQLQARYRGWWTPYVQGLVDAAAGR